MAGGIVSQDYHATVSIYAAIAGTLQLDNVPALIGTPSVRDYQSFGGFVKYVISIDPPLDYNAVRDGDTLRITWYYGHVIDPTRVYYIRQAGPIGFGDLAMHRIIVSDRQAQGG